MKKTDIERIVERVVSDVYVHKKKHNTPTGGKRAGSGRLKGGIKAQDVYGEMTYVRCPKELREEINGHIKAWKKKKLQEYYNKLETKI